MKNLLFLFVALFCVSLLNGQVQIGSTLSGLAASDLFGASVALSSTGDILAVGAPAHATSAGQSVGQVRVFNWDGVDWVQMGDVLEGDSEGDIFGFSLALSADGLVLAVGAAGYDNTNSYEHTGKVQVYAWDGSTWAPRGGAIEGDMANVVLGYSVALSASGDVLAIGAPWYSANFQVNSGQVRLFHWDGMDWQLEATFDGEDAGDQFGTALALSAAGDVLAVGAPQSSANGGLSGAVKIFRKSGGSWEVQGSTLYGPLGSFWGTDVSLSADGQVLAIGAPSTSVGIVQVYSWNGDDWTPLGEELLGAEDSGFGSALTLSAEGDALAVGSPDYSNKAGRVQYYLWDGDTWTQNGEDITGSTLNEKCGDAVAINAGGEWLAVGCSRGNTTSGYDSGSVGVFEFCLPSTSEISITACQAYTVPSGEVTYTESGIYVDEIPNAAGCGDSIITINLTITSVDVSVGYDGSLLVAGAAGASYQWVRCDDDFAWIIGATQSFYEPQEPGSYAVIVTRDGCTDTSTCLLVSSVAVLNMQSTSNAVKLYATPSFGIFELCFDAILLSDVMCSVYNLRGCKVMEINLPKGRQNYQLALPASVTSGLYIWQLTDLKGQFLSSGKLIVTR